MKSHDEVFEQKGADSRRSLPLDRGEVQDFEYGIKEPEKVPVGRATLKQALQFITNHQNDRRRYNAEKIAEDYLIPQETVGKYTKSFPTVRRGQTFLLVEHILKHYKVFEVYFPEQRKSKAKFAGPSIPRLRITPDQQKLLPGKKDET